MMLTTRRRPTAVLRNFPETRWDTDRLFDEFFVRPMVTMNPTGPQADFYETDEEFVLEMNLPGFTEEDVDVNLEQGVLSITGEHSEEGEEEKGTYHLRERSWSRFTRSFSIPHTIDVENVDADFAKGVLKVRLPKAAEAKARKIEIKGG
jgi:HSP20 family protein